MSFRADKQGGGETQWAVRSILAGLDSKTPAHRVAADASPDLLNVVLSGRAVARRGAFVPVARQQPGVGAVRNKGFHLESRTQRTAGANQATFLSVPGCAHAGHRSIWDDTDVRNGLTLDLFVVVDDLTTQHGGNANGAAAPYGPAPFTLKVRPILSKGPIKRFLDEAGHIAGTNGWQTTSRWGPLGAGFHAMPFALYLFNNAGTWEIRFSFHTWVNDQWHLNTISTDLAAIGGVKTGRKYHIVAGYDIFAGTAVLRVGAWFEWGKTYVTAAPLVVTGTPMTTTTPTPVQLFDCPQELIESPAPDHPTRPPGLGLGSQADGGYFFACRRFEGTVEDVVLYRGLVSGAGTGALDRTGRIDPAAPPATRLQHWPMEGGQQDLADEVSGLGNHFVFTPSDPVFDKDGGIDGGALYLNGTTAYALLQMADVNPVDGRLSSGLGGRPCWRTARASPFVRGAWEHSVKARVPHGLEVAFWPESVEPNHEQVVMEAHAAMRLVVGADGKIRLYVRDNAAAPVGYQLVGASAQAVVPGQRYHAIGFRLSGTVAQLWVNGTLEVQANINDSLDASSPVGGLTVGVGSRVVVSGGQVGNPSALTPTADQISVDHRTHFCGRVEYARVLVGSIPYTSTVGTAGLITQRRALLEHYVLPYRRQTQFLVTPALKPLAVEDTVPNHGANHMAVLPQVHIGGKFPMPVLNTASPDQLPLLFWPPPANGGLDNNQGQTVQLLRALCAYDFNQPINEYGYSGRYSRALEFTSAGSAIFHRYTHFHQIYAVDSLGLAGPVQLRCSESDLLSHLLEGGLLSTAALRPFEAKSPRELAPQWAAGMLRPALDQNPISFLADWRHESTGDQFLIGGCRRSVFWLKPMWRKNSPFDDGGASLWLSGQQNDYTRSALAAVGTSWATAVDVIDLWCYPTRLDGNRVLVMRGSRLNDSMRYLLMLRDGQLHVWGQLDGGNTWCFVHGTVLAGPTRNIAGVSVRLNAWNHICVRIGDSTVQAWINGQIAPMGDAALLYQTSAAMGAGTIPAASDIWIGGVCEDQVDNAFPIAAGTATVKITLNAFHGQLTAVRESSSLANFTFTATTSSAPPRARPVVSASTRWVFPLNKVEGWTDASLVGGITLDVAVVEVLPIRTDLGDMGRVAASTVAFRNRLLIVHPKIQSQAVRLVAFDYDQPFLCERLGVMQPHDEDYSFQAPGVVPNGTGTVFAANDSLAFYVSHVSALGAESAIALCGTWRLTGQCTSVGVTNIPRSPDPQVVARRIYLSVGGALPVFIGQLDDNDSTYFEIQSKQGIPGIFTVDPRTRLAAPTGRRIAAIAGSVLVANVDGNPNAFSLSGETENHYPLDRLVPIDSEDGRGITGSRGHLNSLFIFKRNGTWAIEGFGIRQVHTSAGAGGGAAIYDNLVFGSGDRGVWMFDGHQYRYASDALEGEFQAVDISEEAILAQQGAYFYPTSQYWLSVRRVGEAFNQIAYVLHTSAGQGPAWTKVELPKHVVLTHATDPVTERPSLALGTSCGQILRLDPAAVSDAMPAGVALTGAGTVNGKVITSILPLWKELRGVTVHVFLGDAITPIKTRILSNTQTVFHVEHDIGIGNCSFVFGCFDAHWSSAWLEPQQMGSGLKVEAIDLDFEPNTGFLRVEHATAVKQAQSGTTFAPQRPFDPVGLVAEVQSIDMAAGFREQPLPIRMRQQGRYFRFRFGTKVSLSGVPDKFSVTGYALRGADTGTKGMPT